MNLGLYFLLFGVSLEYVTSQLESPQEAIFNNFMDRVARYVPDLIHRLLVENQVVPHWTDHDQVKLEQGMVSLLEETNSTDCADCRSFYLLVQTLVKAGNGFDELRNLSMDICYDGLTPHDPDILCDGLVDNYAPHIIYIQNVTEKTPLEICQQVNKCFPEDVPQQGGKKNEEYAKPRDHAPFPARRQRAPSKKRNGRIDNELQNTFKVLHLADLHVDEFYKQGEPTVCGTPTCCREMFSGEGVANRWGHYTCNIPFETLDRYFTYLNSLEPDLIVYTGDSCPSTEWLETQAGQLNVSEQVAQKIGEYFPGIPAFTTIGNHEMYPTNLYYLPRPEIQELNREILRYWVDLSDFGLEQIRTFERAGYYSILVRPGLRVIGWNTNYGYTFNFYNILNDDSAPEYVIMKEYLQTELAAAENNGEKVVFIGHHPPGGDGSMDYDNIFISDLLAQYADTVIFYLLGHTHTDEFRLIRDSVTGDPRVTALANAAMTSSPYRNPTAKLYYLDPQTFTPIDADAFAVDLSVNGNSVDLEVDLAYRYSSEYGMDDLTAQSFYDLTDRMSSDPELLRQYLYNRVTRSSDPGVCEGTCKTEHLCRILNTVYEQERACLDGGTWEF